MPGQDDTSILSTAGGGQADLLGIPRSSATGEIIVPPPPPGAEPGIVQVAVGMPVQTPPHPQPGVPDAMSTPVGPPIGTTLEEIVEKQRKEDLSKSMHAAAIAAGIPVDLINIAVPGASQKGREPKKFAGDPEQPVMPGTVVYYWTSLQGNRGWMTVWPVAILRPMMARDPKDPASPERPTGAYVGAGLKEQQHMTRVMHAGRPSPVPRLGHFTPIWQFPPDMCRIDAKANMETPA